MDVDDIEDPSVVNINVHWLVFEDCMYSKMYPDDCPDFCYGNNHFLKTIDIYIKKVWKQKIYQTLKQPCQNWKFWTNSDREMGIGCSKPHKRN